MTYSDSQILETVNHKDKVSYKRLYDTYYAPLCRYASRLLHEADCGEEDIVQEVFIRFWENDTVFENIRAITAYLYRAVYNACVNWLRDRKKFVSSGVEKLSVPISFESDINERFLIEEEYFRRIYLAIDTLADQRRQIVLKTLEGKKIETIAEELNISVNTVKTLKRKAYDELRQKVSQSVFAFLLLLSGGSPEL